MEVSHTLGALSFLIIIPPRGITVIAVRGDTHVNENLEARTRTKARERKREGERERERERERDMVHKAWGIIARGRKLHARVDCLRSHNRRTRKWNIIARGREETTEGVYTRTCVRGLRTERPYVALNSETRKLHFELMQNRVSERL